MDDRTNPGAPLGVGNIYVNEPLPARAADDKITAHPPDEFSFVIERLYDDPKNHRRYWRPVAQVTGPNSRCGPSPILTHAIDRMVRRVVDGKASGFRVMVNGAVVISAVASRLPHTDVDGARR